MPYPEQLAGKESTIRARLAPYADAGGISWELPPHGREQGFRNKAKLAVAGTVEVPVLGIVSPDRAVDLRDCPLYEPALIEAIPELAAFITTARLAPYELGTRRGELKFLIVTAAPSGQLMVRFVCRSQEPVARIRKHLPVLLDRLPALRVASVNVQPVHQAVLEGELEIVLTEEQTLPMDLGEISLALRPQSFFQTNTAIAAELYGTARRWSTELPIGSVVDLFCGVGGFALHLATPGRRVLGIEISADAVAAAQETARGLGIEATFTSGDAGAGWPPPDELAAQGTLLVVNPPRRGIGAELCRTLAQQGPEWVLYSSCQSASLVQDLAALDRYRIVRARLFDMFPQTSHAEVLVLLRRLDAPAD